MKKFLLSVATSSLLATLSYAGGDIEPVQDVIIPQNVETVNSISGLYMGAAIGSMKLANDLTGESFTTKTITLQVGYEIYDYLAIEGRYTRGVGDVQYKHGNLSIADISNYPTDMSNIALYLKPKYQYEDFTAYALLGYGEVTVTNIPQGDKDRAESGFQWGLGLGYLINDTYELFADYTVMYDGIGFDHRATNANNKVDTINFGFNYKF